MYVGHAVFLSFCVIDKKIYILKPEMSLPLREMELKFKHM